MPPRATIGVATFRIIAATCALFWVESAVAQSTSQIRPPSALPRPGYEPRTIRLGSVVISPELTVSETYDSNVFATAENAQDDLVTRISPRIRIETGPEELSFFSEAFATHAEYLEHSTESRTSYGASIGSGYVLNHANRFEAAFNYNREAESRADPESDIGRDDPIASFDRFSGSLGYRFHRNRLGLGLGASFDQIDYEADADAERDQLETGISARTSLLLTPKFDTFIEGYSSRRDYQASTDESGIDRDSTSYGFLAGTGIDLTGKLVGEIGVGIFQTDHDDDALDDFLGVGVRGALQWSISPRTLLIGTVTREGAGTVLAGATSQIQTDVGLRLEQEVRHNFLLNTELIVSERDYEGIARDLTTVATGITGELLLTRVSSVALSAEYSTRYADLDSDEYDRLMLTFGVRFRF